MSLFTEKEIAYLQAHQLGRLATSGKTGIPHVIPTGFHLDIESGTIRIGQNSLEDRGQQRLYVRHLGVNPHAAFVVDDLATEPAWAPSGITIKGSTVLHTEGGEVLGPGFGPHWVELVPNLVSAWGIDADPFAPVAPRKA